VKSSLSFSLNLFLFSFISCVSTLPLLLLVSVVSAFVETAFIDSGGCYLEFTIKPPKVIAPITTGATQLIAVCSIAVGFTPLSCTSYIRNARTNLVYFRCALSFKPDLTPDTIPLLVAGTLCQLVASNAFNQLTSGLLRLAPSLSAATFQLDGVLSPSVAGRPAGSVHFAVSHHITAAYLRCVPMDTDTSKLFSCHSSSLYFLIALSSMSAKASASIVSITFFSVLLIYCI